MVVFVWIEEAELYDENGQRDKGWADKSYNATPINLNLGIIQLFRNITIEQNSYLNFYIDLFARMKQKIRKIADTFPSCHRKGIGVLTRK